ncbi:hypothetical protein E8L99_15550 [Phreatobacter aquaticus]|uniref:DUF680 domain-containing protein n=1 Tax=Phreatobacter aquaticus TaxID=2570229 RepID=A0A4D7QNH7_9HYPH|nr:hypothetical protein [Phreatobacter aquaticus]QCK87076.1 hypothetical protein E8L99_15550 [Phreatobacter aquaticus]
MKKIILAASLLAPLALGSAAMAQEAGSFSSPVTAEQAVTNVSSPREFTLRNVSRPAAPASQSGYQAEWPQGNGFGS